MATESVQEQKNYLKIFRHGAEKNLSLIKDAFTKETFANPWFKLTETGHVASDTKMPLNILLSSALKTHPSEAQYATHLPKAHWGHSISLMHESSTGRCAILLGPTSWNPSQASWNPYKHFV